MTTRLATDESQQIIWRLEGEAFATAEPEALTDISINVRFPGQYFDSETGLHYNWHRYYDPSLGRYITSDPIGLDGGLNTFGYVGGNSLKFYDFLGLMEVCPVSPPRNDPDWVPYHGDPSVFHCDYEGYHENREPTPDDPRNECFYDECGELVDENHEYKGCRGTPNQYPSDDVWNHTFIDSGGIRKNGVDAYQESSRKERDDKREAYEKQTGKQGCYMTSIGWQCD